MAAYIAPLLNGIAVSGLVLFLVHKLVWRKRSRLPPGPRSIPILGNVHQLPLSDQPRTFAEWAKIYGDLFYVQLFRTPAIVIDSVEVAQDLMDKRSSKYSDRPALILITKLMGWDPVCSFLPYGKRWLKQRQWIQSAYTDKSSLADYKISQRRETNALLASLLEEPSSILICMKRFSAALILDTVLGHDISPENDVHFQIAMAATEGTNESGSPASTLVDFLPFLRHYPTWAPGAGFKRRALEVRALVRLLMDKPFETTQTAIASGTAKPSFMRKLIVDMPEDGDSKDHREDIKGAAAVLFGAGIDTTTITLWTFVLAMTIYPQYYKKAQAEIDAVIGSTRLPELDDRASLPYLECILREVYRLYLQDGTLQSQWECVAHRLSEDDTYGAYQIAKGTVVIPNIWSMTHDPELFPDPETFNPDRWLYMTPEQIRAGDPSRVVFGFGRRICPGRYFVNANFWLVVANVIAAFDIRKAIDTNGNEITPMAKFKTAFTSWPEEFACDTRPRSEIHRELVLRMVEVNS